MLEVQRIQHSLDTYRVFDAYNTYVLLPLNKYVLFWLVIDHIQFFNDISPARDRS